MRSFLGVPIAAHGGGIVGALVVPVGWSYNADQDSIDVGGREFEPPKNYRDVKRSGRAAIVVDDLANTDPRRPQGVEVRGPAEAIGGDRP